MASPSPAPSTTTKVEDGDDVESVANLDKLKDLSTKPTSSKPLNLPLIGQFFDRFAPGIAGLVLVISGFFPGWRMSLFALRAAAVMVVGHSFGIGNDKLAIGIGLAIAVVRFIFGRSKR